MRNAPQYPLHVFVDAIRADVEATNAALRRAIDAAKAKAAAEAAHASGAQADGSRVQHVWTQGLPPWVYASIMGAPVNTASPPKTQSNDPNLPNYLPPGGGNG